MSRPPYLEQSDLVRLQSAQSLAAFRDGEAIPIPPQGVPIGTIPALASPGPARTQFLAHMALTDGRSVEELTVEADQGVLMVRGQHINPLQDDVQISPQAWVASGSVSASAQNLDGLDLDFPIRNANRLVGGTISHYADFITSEQTRILAEGSTCSFTGSGGAVGLLTM